MFNSEVAKQPWFLEILKEVENGNKVGYDGTNWSPHRSPEGGKDTIGYGHKILTDIVNVSGKNLNLKFDRLSDKDINGLLIQDVALSEKKASEEFTELQPMGKDVRWQDLPLQYKVILTELMFNIGTLKNKNERWGWPGLTKGMKDNNHPTILKEINRKFTDASGEVKPLTSRVSKLKKVYKERLGQAPVPSGSQIDRLKSALPFFDDLGKFARARLLAKMVAEDEQKNRERSVKQTQFNLLMEEANERDREVREQLEENRRAEAEATLQREVEGELAVREEQTLSTFNTRLEVLEKTKDETTQVIDEPLADVQFFQRPDGSVIKVTGEQAEELLSGS